MPRARPRWIVGLEGFSLLLIAASAALVLARLGGMPPLHWWPLLAASALAGVCAGDLVTGIAHWCFDRCFEESTPGIGPALVRPFRDHHRDPGAIVRHGFLEVSGNNALALSPPLWLCTSLASDFGRELAATALLSCALGGVATAFVSNQIHRWAHAAQAPRAVRCLQRRGWILSPEAHARHHRGAHDRAYCVATGWMNPLLDRLGVFGALERALRMPRRARS